MELTLPPDWLNHHPLLQQVAQILHHQGIEAYLVGGAVRDLLLGREAIVDLDFAVPGNGLTIARRVADALDAAFYALDPERGVGRVICDGPRKNYLDFAAFRGSTLEADLADRDFTVNAIALSLEDSPAFIDLFDGRRDLAAGQIRAVSDLALQNDPVRVLRAVRQATEFNFALEANTQHLLRRAAPALKNVSPERQRDELLKLLNTPAPDRAVKMLRDLDVLPYFLPEVAAMTGVDQSPPHYLNVFDHTLAALAAWAQMRRADFAVLPDPLRPAVQSYLQELLTGHISRQELLPLALLLHDTGKPLTCSEDDQAKIRFLGHERESAKIAQQVLHRFRFSAQATTYVRTVVAQHMRPLLLAQEQSVSRRAVYRFFRDTAVGAGAGVATVLHALADQQATYPPSQGQVETQAVLNVVQQLLTAYFERRDQAVDPPPLLTGRDLMTGFGLTEGRLIGLMLSRLKEAQAIGQVQTRAEAVAFLRADPEFAKYSEEN